MPCGTSTMPSIPILIVKASQLQSANDERFNAEVASLLDQAHQRLPARAGLERNLLNAVSAAYAGQGVQAARCYEHLLLERPDNLFLNLMGQEQIFWLGNAQWMHELIESTAPSWRETHKDYGPLLSLRAFANEEAGFFAEAERYGRAAVEIAPSDVWGAHAVAHVMDMQGDAKKGIEWLSGLSENWGHANQMRHHLWWHYCLFLFELGEYDRVIALMDTEVRNLDSPLVKESPAATIDITNYTSLLMRLELYGVDVSAHWQKLSSICKERVSNHGSVFSNIHDMMVLTGSGDQHQAIALLDSMKQRFEESSQIGETVLAYKMVGIPACEAILAHRARDFNRLIQTLGGVRHQLHLMGASHAQRDVFYHLLVHAAEQEQRDDLREMFIKEIERLGFCDVPARAAYKEKTS